MNDPSICNKAVISEFDKSNGREGRLTRGVSRKNRKKVMWR